ncbi:MAG: DUF222 domain-containing protein, partial [Micromonosporaceae bacterium]
CEVAVALQLTRTAAEGQLGLATGLAKLPAVHQALASGRIDLARAKVIVLALTDVPDLLATAIAAAAVRIAENLTSGQLGAKLAALIIRADPDAARRRYERALADRKVVCGRNGGGHTAFLSGCDLPPDRAAGAFTRINDIADELKRGGDPRSIDQLRADIYLDLLEGRELPTRAAARPGVVDLVVPLATLAGLSEASGLIPGFGPVIADVARQLAAQAPRIWRYRVHDKRGRLLHHGRLRTPPPPATAPPVTSRQDRPPPTNTASEYAFVRARDQHCRFPTCRSPASRCDVDHTIQRRAGGGHTRDNLALACRHHHRAKDEGGYQLRQLGNGTLQWTTSLGHTYTTDPDPPF